MNSNILSTNQSNITVDRYQLILKAESLLNKGSNYEYFPDGKVLIKSENKYLKGLRKKVLKTIMVRFFMHLSQWKSVEIFLMYPVKQLEEDYVRVSKAFYALMVKMYIFLR